MPTYIQVNESDATRRRLYFFLVSPSFALPAEAEEGGQPQVSHDGSAWTSTGIGTLVAQGEGYYYADLTQAAVATVGDTINSRYSSATAAECPGDTAQVVVYDPDGRTPAGDLLVTVEYAKTLLGITTSAEDDRLAELIRAGGAAMERELGRRLLRDDYVEYYHGNGRHALALRNRPVWSVTSVKVDATGYAGQGTDPFASTTALTAGTDYYLDYDGEDAGVSSPAYSTGYMTTQPMASSGLLYRIRDVWPRVNRWREWGLLTGEGNPPPRGNIKVTYEGGFTELPADLAYALCLGVGQMRLFLKRGMMPQSERIGDYSYTLWTQAMVAGPANPFVLATVNDTLARYREMPW